MASDTNCEQLITDTRYDAARLTREQLILDKGYDAVRLMATEMVENGSTLADILFHANQMWHEFKVGAVCAGCIEAIKTGMYMDQYKAKATKQIILADERYETGYDAVRQAQIMAAIEAGAFALPDGNAAHSEVR